MLPDNLGNLGWAVATLVRQRYSLVLWHQGVALCTSRAKVLPEMPFTWNEPKLCRHAREIAGSRENGRRLDTLAG
jgi:hypothetical protein